MIFINEPQVAFVRRCTSRIELWLKEVVSSVEFAVKRVAVATMSNQGVERSLVENLS